MIATVDPTHGPEGTGVVIRGEHFGSAIGAAQGRAGVGFGGVWAEPSYWSEAEIRAAVPEGVASGLVAVTVGAQTSNGVEFTVTAGGKGTAGAVATTVSAATSDGEEENSGPEITSLSPEEGAVGTSVTVAGTGFGAAQGNSTVSFNGVVGVPTSWSETAIQVPVPAGATSGPVTVTVGGQQSNGVEFRLPRPLTISADTTLYEGDPVKQVKVSVPAGEEPTTNTPVTFTFGGTATPEDDYEMVETVTLEAGKRAVKTTLEVVDDEPFEVPETLTLEAAAAGYDSSPVVTIVIYDDNYTPLTLTADPSSVAEPWGRSTVTVSVEEGKQPATDTVVTIFAFPSSTATKEIDYTLETELTILGRHRSAETTLEVIDDAVDEGKERIKLIALAHSSSGFSESSPLGIPLIDDDTAGVTVTPASLSLTEEGTGTTYQVRLDSEPTHAVTITIDSDNPDLEVDPASLSFGPGNWSTPRAVTVAAAHDDGYDDESGTLTHGADSEDPNYEGIAIDGVTVAVEDDELPPLTLTADAASVSEPNGTTTLRVTVPEGAAPPADATITLTHSGSASNGTDYTVGTLTIMARDLSGTATLRVRDDTVYEGPETILLKADHSGYQESGVVEISLIDDEQKLMLTVAPEVVSESAPNRQATVTVSVLRAVPEAVEVTLNRRGTAESNDYRLAETVTIPAGGTSALPATLTVVDDGEYEVGETIELWATATATPSYEPSDRVKVLIEDNEPPQPLAVSVSTHQHGGLEVSHLREGEPAYRTYSVTVSVPQPVPAPVVVALNRTGTADEGDDYRLATTVTIPKDMTSVETPLTVVDDDPFEVPETLTLQAATDDDGYVSSPKVTVWIYDDNFSKLTLSAEASTVSEPNGTVRVTASVEEGKELAADATVFLGFGLTATATHKTDFRLTKRLTLPAEQNSVSTVLTVIDDGAYEGDERIELLASGDGTSALSQSEILTIQLEDDDPAITDFTPKRGGAGVVVTISGDNLAGATAVRFGEGETSEIEGDSDTEIRATVPAGATTGPITVVTPAGTATSTGIFTVRQLYLEVDPASVGEAAGQRTATVTVRVNEAVTADGGLTVTLAHPGMGTGKAARDTDYTLVRTVTIAQTKTSAPVATLTVVDDGEYEGEETILLQATAPDYGASNEVTVTVEDDDPTITDFTPKRGAPGVVVTISGDNFTEQGTTVQFNGVAASKVTVDSATEIRATVPPGAATGPITVVTPGGTVASTDLFRVLRLHIQVDPATVKEKAGGRTATVTVSVDDAVDQVGGLPVTFTFGGTADRGRFEDYTMDQTVTIPNGKTSAPAVTLTVRDDRDHEEEETITIQAGADGYEASEVVEVTLISDDLPELILACPLSLSEEAAGTENILVYLPFTRDVPTDISFAFKGTATRGTDYTMDQTVTIGANESSASVPLTVIDDRRHEGDETIDLEASADGFQTVFCVFSIEDTDPVEPPLTLSVSSASVGEASGKRTATVTVSVDEAVEADGGLPVTFTFGGTADRETDPDYTMDQTVTILNTKTSAEITLTVVDDAVAESDETITITAGATDYSDSEAVTVTIADDDVPGVTVTEASLSITEGKSGTYKVKLDTQPTADVTITVTSSDEGAVTVTPASLTFTAGNWNTARAVTVEAVHDEDIADETATLTHVAAGGDTNYAGIDIDSVSVSVTDDEVPGVTVTPTRLSITEGGSKSYQVKLKTRPSADVTISMSSSNSDVQVPSTALTFTTTTGATGGWDQLQSVRVRIAHDDNTSDESGTITHVAASSDTDYVRGASDNPSVLVSVSDDDPTGPEQLSLSLSPRSRVSEPSGTTTVWVSVPTAVGADTTVTLHHPGTGSGRATHGSDYTLAGSVTITEGGTVATTTLTVVDDALDEPDETIQLYASATDYRDSPTRTVTIVDNDPSRLSLSVSPASVPEKGGTSTVTVSVPSWAAPSSDLRVTLTHPGSGTGVASSDDYTLAGSVTLEANETSVTTTLRADDDTKVEGNERVQIQASAAGFDPSSTRTVTIIDDDDPFQLRLSVSPASVSETAGERTSTIRVTVPAGAELPSSVALDHPRGGTATSDDYTIGALAKRSNAWEATLTVVDDSRVEDNETVLLQASATDYDPSPERKVTIVDNDRHRLGLSVSPASVSETAGERTSTIRVTVPAGAALPSSVDLDHPRDGTASSNDYTIGTLTKRSNAWEATLTVIDDSRVELDETVLLKASATGYDPSLERKITIVDDDQPENQRPVVEAPISDMTLEEGEQTTINLSPYFSDPDGDSLRYSAISSDMSKVTELVDNAEDTLTVTGVAVTGSPKPTVTVTASDGSLSTSQTFSVTVVETPQLGLSVSPASVSETAGERTSTIRVTVPAGAALPSSVDLDHPRDGTASSNDYTIGTLTKRSNAWEATLTVIDDSRVELDETVLLKASATGYDPSLERKITIVDDDQPENQRPVVEAPISDMTLEEGEQTTINLSPYFSDPDGDSLRYSAISSDMSKVTELVDNAEDTLTVTGVAVTGSPKPTVTVTASDGSLSTSQTFSVTVVETPQLGLSVSPASVSETAGERTSTIRVTVPAGAALPSSVDLDHPRDGTASSNDYTIGTLTKRSNAWEATLTVIDDSRVELDETVLLKASATGYDPSLERKITIVDDDPPPGPEITSIRPPLRKPDKVVIISGHHFGSTPGSVSFGGYTVGDYNFTGSNSDYSWSNSSIRLLIPGSLHAGQVYVTVTTHEGRTSNRYPYTVTGDPVQRDECDGEEDCPDDSKDKGETAPEEESEDSSEEEGGG